VDGQRFSAESAFVWDGRDDSGAPVPPGIYLVRAETLPDGDAAPKAASLALTVVDRGAP
jgi:flagellar hook assembly protein FlgD